MENGMSAVTTKIRTYYELPPIPLRDFDWAAFSEDYEPGWPVGRGRTEQEAIEDLNEQLELLK